MTSMIALKTLFAIPFEACGNSGRVSHGMR